MISTIVKMKICPKKSHIKKDLFPFISTKHMQCKLQWNHFSYPNIKVMTFEAFLSSQANQKTKTLIYHMGICVKRLTDSWRMSSCTGNLIQKCTCLPTLDLASVLATLAHTIPLLFFFFFCFFCFLVFCFFFLFSLWSCMF